MRRRPQGAGRALIIIGLLIIMTVVLPQSAWWILLGLVLLWAGLRLCRF